MTYSINAKSNSQLTPVFTNEQKIQNKLVRVSYRNKDAVWCFVSTVELILALIKFSCLVF